MLLDTLGKKNLLRFPAWLPNNTVYLTIMGSHAYGTTQDDSDLDIFGVAIPPKEQIFPHLAGVIPGFGTQIKMFDEIEQHHIIDKEADKDYDVKVLGIIKFFELARQGNPNIIDVLFVPQNCILHVTQIGNIIRENRHEFLSKLCWAKFKGYAFGQMKHMKNKEPVGKRKTRVDKYGYDTKFAMHLFRLLNEIEQILTTGDLDLQLNREQNKAIRRGEWKEQDIYDYFNQKERDLETVFLNSKLRNKPDESKLKNILTDCLEAHYGSLDKVVVRQDESLVALRDIDRIINKLKENKVL